MDITVKREFKHATIFYLKQLGGGSCEISYNATFRATKQTVSTDGELELGILVLHVKSEGQRGITAVRNINGIVVVLVVFLNDNGVAI
ncbi:hypothetical protein M3612_17885 [Niallia taxi]|uniref:hypothetical protein n=1 Tax=Niallia taxi TaxID=2499688 RepID=UPI00203E9FD7|nr:hypothetical protein [Niallia taxi]MCM3216358.1 hypothetical protein [Niallia taxi]